MRKERNISEILILKSLAKSATHGVHVNTIKDSMAVGEAVIVSPTGIVVNAAGTLPESFKVAVKLSNGALQFSDIIYARNIRSINAQKYVAPTLPQLAVGFNGTSGAIEVKTDNLYLIRIYYLPLDKMGFSRQEVRFGAYKTGSSATQGEIATALVNSLVANLSRMPEKLKTGVDAISVFLLNSGNAVASSGGSVTVIKGSRYVQIVESANGANDAGKYNADNSTIAVGDYLRFGSVSNKTMPVGKVLSVTGAGTNLCVVELDLPYQGDSQTIAPSAVGVIAAANVGDFGILLKGNFMEFNVGKFHYQLPVFTVSAQQFGNTPITELAKVDLGSGNWRQVSEMEQQFQGNEENFYRLSPFEYFRSEVSANSNYALVTIEHTDSLLNELGTEAHSLKTTILACEKGNGTVYSDANVGIGTTLNAYITTYKIPFSFSTSATIATEINS